jgi:hypothetical protein
MYTSSLLVTIISNELMFQYEIFIAAQELLITR